ncbi:hypothetical protein LAN17_23120, partial [Mycobacterium tuberculosis]|nr:hypothetical protein [Mycobacterium tuberculosis]
FRPKEHTERAAVPDGGIEASPATEAVARSLLGPRRPIHAPPRPATRGALTDAAVYDKNYHQEAVIPVAPGGETHGGTDVFIGARGLGA